eukprot:gene3260-3538_t
MNKLPEADIRKVTWGSNVYEPSDLYKQSRPCVPDSVSSSSTGQSCSYLATDINPEAVAATAQTLHAHGLQVAGVELVQTDLLTGLMPRLTGSVDLLVLLDGIARAWAGGHRGRVVTDRVLPLLSQLLSPAGHAFIVTVPENQPQDIINLLQAQGLA